LFFEFEFQVFKERESLISEFDIEISETIFSLLFLKTNKLKKRYYNIFVYSISE